jgi:hypothetical protein
MWMLLFGLGCLDTDLSPLTDVRPRSRDVEPPRVVAISLGGLDDTPEDVSLLPAIDVDFSEPLDEATLDADSVVLRAEDPIEIAWTLAGVRLSISPGSRLAPFTDHTLALTAKIRDLHGAPLSGPDGRAAPFEYAFETGDSAAGPPVATLVEPAEDATGVPTNLAHLALSFNEAVGPGRISIGGAPADDATMDDLIATLDLDAELPPSITVNLYLDGFLDDDGDAPLAADLSFETGDGPDWAPPALLPVACAAAETQVDALCVSAAGDVATVRLAANEPVRALVVLDDGAVHVEARSDASATAHAIEVRGLVPERLVALELAATDLADNRVTVRGSFDSGEPLPPLVLSEVYADPIGPEPDQEFVEIVNVGTEAVALDGLAVADGGGTGDPISGSAPLAAGAYAILVHPAFALSGADPSPAPGALVVRLSGPIGSNGLLNSGEPVSIVDALGRTITIAPDLLAPRTGVSIERTDFAGDPYDAGTWAHNPTSSATPGAPNAARR